jgi:hypothetical protein
MMNKNIIFDDLSDVVAVWCGADIEAAELARMVDNVSRQNVGALSVVPAAVPVVWPWMEEMKTKIFARFYFPNSEISDDQISDVTIRINNAFKQGAHGAQIFMPYAALANLVEQTHVIRGDLFFNKDLVIGIDIADIASSDLDELFGNLRKINASALMLVLTKDLGAKSDFVGRLYGLLENWNSANNFDLHFALGRNFVRIEQAARLIQVMQPQLAKKMKFFVNY